MICEVEHDSCTCYTRVTICTCSSFETFLAQIPLGHEANIEVIALLDFYNILIFILFFSLRFLQQRAEWIGNVDKDRAVCRLSQNFEAHNGVVL